MAALDFPASPTLDQEYSANGMTFRWGGSKWERVEPFVLEPWVRPADWLPLPSVVGQEKFVGLLPVFEGSTFLKVDAMSRITVDWGDGSPTENINAEGSAEHVYDWSDVPSNTLCSRGYRQVIVTVTPQSGFSFYGMGFQSQASMQGTFDAIGMVDVAFNGPTLNQVYLRPKMLEHVSSPLNKISDFSFFFSDANSLRSVELYTSAGTDFSYMFRDCASLVVAPNLDTSLGTNFSNMFALCASLRYVPQLDTSSGLNFSRMFSGCVALQQVPVLDTSSGTDFNNMFVECLSLAEAPALDTSSGTNFSAMFKYCTALRRVPTLDTSAALSAPEMFAFCRVLAVIPALDLLLVEDLTDFALDCGNLRRFLPVNARANFSLSGKQLTAAALNEVFTNLYPDAYTVDISNCLGALTCDPSVAEAKGWTVVGGPP